MNDWYNYSWMEVVEKLGSDSKVGLKSEQIETIREKYGSNIIFNIEKRNKFSVAREVFLAPWFVLLILAGVLMLYSKNYFSGTILIVFSFFGNYIFNFDELLKTKSINQLEKIDEVKSSVIRDGQTLQLSAKEIVIGDIVLFQKESSIPADLRVIECKSLKVKQTAITGENYEVEKYDTKIEDKDISLVEMKNMLFKNSVVLEGMGAGIVTAVGYNTEVGKIVKSLIEDTKPEEQFKVLIKRSFLILDIFALLGFFISIGISYFYGMNMQNVFGRSALVLGSFLPINLVVIIGMYFQTVKKHFKNKGIYIKNFSSIEIAAKIRVIITQKLGFFTENEMTVAKIYTEENTMDCKLSTLMINKNTERILQIALLCNNNSKNNAEERALIEFGKKNSMDIYNVSTKYRRLFEIPFDIEKGTKTTVNKIEKKYRAHVVGAVDKIIERCNFIMKDGVEVEITEDDIKNIVSADIEMSSECMNVTAFAYRNFTYAPSQDENIESYLVFVGLVGFLNPIKDESMEILSECQEMFHTIVTSEDSKLTSVSFANKLGINASTENVICGIELDNMDATALNNHVNKIRILSRLSMKNKLRVINAIKERGKTILITGTNLLDIALFEAGDLKVAFKETCSTTLRASSDVYIENPSYKTLVSYLTESRIVYIKLICFLKYAFALSICEGVYILLLSFFKDINLQYGYLAENINIVFILISCLYFAIKSNTKKNILENFNSIQFTKTIFNSVLIGICSFIVVIICTKYFSSISFIVSLFTLPLMELLFVNRKFNSI